MARTGIYKIFDWLKDHGLVEKYNPHHYPAGSGKGGQFAPKVWVEGEGKDSVVRVPRKGKDSETSSSNNPSSPTTQKQPALNVPGADAIKDQGLRKKYEEAYTQYSSMTTKEIEQRWTEGKEFEKVRNCVVEWSTSTLTVEGTHLKTLAQQVEGLPGQVRYRKDYFPKGEKDYIASVRARKNDLPSPEDYVMAKALSSAFVQKKYGDGEVFLLRGTNGTTGRVLQGELPSKNKKDAEIKIKQDVLSGYTIDVATARKFGMSQGGITVGANIKTKDILFPPEFMSKHFAPEKEFITLNHSEVVAVKRANVEPPRRAFRGLNETVQAHRRA